MSWSLPSICQLYWQLLFLLAILDPKWAVLLLQPLLALQTRIVRSPFIIAISNPKIFVFLLTVVRGLLYMAALHHPTDLDCTSLSPSPSLHVHAVGHSSLCGCSLAESSDTHPCLDGSLLHCACLVQWLACQSDVDYTSLHNHVDGLLPWPAVNSCICCSSDNSNSESLTYCLNHRTCDQLCLLWHQRLGHLHS